MSRHSWSSNSSDAEVQRHFDQPFASSSQPLYDLGKAPTHDADEESDHSHHEEQGDDDSESRASYDSFDDADSLPPLDDPPNSSSPPPDPIDDSLDQSNQAICRICLESSSSDESLGRLLSPCRCKGTMKYVHATCLDQWRAASARSSSSVACDQCGAPYRFRKSRFVGLATSPTLLFVVSLGLFLLLIWSVGVVATFAMDLYDTPVTQRKAKSSWWPWRSSSMEDDAVYTDAWSYLDADYTTPGLWSYSTLMYEPAAYVRLIKEAVRSFASGEAVDAVREVVGLQDSPELQQQLLLEDAQEERGFWSNLKNEWMYGDGGLWQRSGASSSQAAQDAAASVSSSAEHSAAAEVKGKGRERYDARAASDANDPNAVKRRRQRSSKSPSRSSSKQITEPTGWLNKLFVQFSVGFSLVGILSFCNILIGASFLGPINLHNFGLGRSFARMTSSGRGGGRNGNRDGVNIASILIVLLVVIGVVRALHVVYKLVRKGARRGLSRLEAVIVDWNHDEDAGEGKEGVTIVHDEHQEGVAPAPDDGRQEGVVPAHENEVGHQGRGVRARRAFALGGFE